MLFEELGKANIQALRDHDKTARSILSVVYGKCKNESIAQGLNAKELPDGDCLRIIQKAIKELDEEALGYQKANRPDDVAEIEAQKAVIARFLPKMMSEEEIRHEIAKLEDKSVPVVMKHFKANFNGLCDMGLVSRLLKEMQ